MPVKRFLVRNSGRTDFVECRWRYRQAYVERLRPNEGGMNALVFGDIVHRSLADWYIPEKSRKKVKRGRHPRETLERIFDELDVRQRRSKMRLLDPDDEKFIEARELGVAMMDNYVNAYGQDEEIMVIYPEMPFQLDVYNEQGQYVFTQTGTTDCLCRDRRTGAWFLLEHKTAASITTGHLVLDEQANTYSTLLPAWLWENEILPPDVDVEYMMYNFLKKTTLDFDGPQNAAGLYLKDPTIQQMKDALAESGVVYSTTNMKKEDYKELCTAEGIDWEQLGDPKSDQPSDLFHRERVTRAPIQREKALERIMQQVREMKALHAGTLPVYKAPGKMKCNFCQYRDMCEMDEYGEDITRFVETQYHHWNPFKDHIWSLNLTD
ncbi:MAG: hypothetical protein GTO63_12325 [Anaerolineae bacterium]|nr:hypothetical protein [Anaerolineae bacterium]NIN95679.1 hypothetical protein [Anaerolineae bacterium]